jgi:hypothetical protein
MLPRTYLLDFCSRIMRLEIASRLATLQNISRERASSEPFTWRCSHATVSRDRGDCASLRPVVWAVFSPDAFTQFQLYVSGLIVSENKTVDGIIRLFVIDVRNQSSLNRLLTARPFAVDALNHARLNLLSSLPGTQLKPRGV